MKNKVNTTDVTLMTLALADFGSAAAAFMAHDYWVGGSLSLIGVLLVYLYHKFGSVS